MTQQPPEHTPNFALPVVEQEVIDSFEHHTPGFDDLFKQLQGGNPKLARWIMRRTEKLAPQSIKEKEIYGRVALELYSLLSDQKIIDDFLLITDITDVVVAPSADEYGDGEVQPPAA